MVSLINPYSRGSEWRKWDLQIHTYLDPNWRWPSGYPNGNDKQEERIKKFNSDFIKHCVFINLNIVAITDHNTGEAIDGLIEGNEQQGHKITLLPGVEVISTEGTHLLVIFNPDKQLKNRWSTWKETIDHFLTAIFTNQPRFEQKNGRNTPSNAPVPIDTIIQKAKDFYALTLFPHVLTNGGIFNCDARTRKRVLKLCNILDIACGLNNLQNKILEIDNKLKGQEFNLEYFAYINTSDSRQISDVGCRFTWIKADPTFEGLKQIVYEPKYRVYIGVNKPKFPSNFIDSITLNVQDNAKITNSQGEEETFCFSGYSNHQIILSPYFNCFIGGRGTGKSTLLNLIGLNSSSKTDADDFFGKKINASNFNPGECLLTQTNMDFEFIGQNRIDEIASDYKEITKLIYDRISVFGGEGLEKSKKRLLLELEEISNRILLYDQKINLENDLLFKESEKEKLNNVIKTLESNLYKQATEEIDKLIKELNKLLIRKDEAIKLEEEIDKLLDKNVDINDLDEKVSDKKSIYEVIYKKALIKLKEASDLFKTKEIIKNQLKEQNTTDKIKKIERNLEILLRKNGLSEEDILEAKTAKSKVSQIKKYIESLKQQVELKKREVSYNLLDLKKIKEDYEKKVEEALQPLQKGLLNQNKYYIGKIEVKYDFDEEEAWRKIALDFYTRYRSLLERGQEQFISDLIFELRNKLKSEITAELLKEIVEKNTEASKSLNFFFDEPYSKEVFYLIRDKYLNDTINHKILKVTYNNRLLKDASFGQRSTAAIVILLLFGTKPLIIDEPEAHLDSKLINDYLVPLIKNRKQTRQIIFATHNANFVINGDAEQIYILEMPGKKTIFTQTTIENMNNRESLLNLEGGRQAFKNREKKYDI